MKTRTIGFILILLPFSAMTLISCSGSRVSSVKGTLHRDIRLALAPSGGLMADAIGVELFNRGFTVFDTNQMTNLLFRLNMNEIELSDPKNLSALYDEGIDAVLHVKASVAFDGRPQSASIRVNGTSSGRILAGLSWQNGWAANAGSVADRAMRKDLADAAVEIVDNLLSVE